MKNEVMDFILDKKLILKGETIGVACSGGIDSMCLLHYLNSIKDEIGFNVIAITVDHMIRGEESNLDCEFVKDWCKQREIPFKKFTVDALKISQEKNIGVEEAAREARYGIFENLLNKKVVNKIALAHHISDQVETILLHIFRGSGLNGAIGMSENRDDRFIRPFLQTKKEDIVLYASQNEIEHVEDSTNSSNKYNRNYLRNEVLPILKQKWENIEQNIINFASSCKEDNDYILSHVSINGIICENNEVKIPILYFHYESSVINRIIFISLKKLCINKDIERKHIDLIKNLAFSENGKKINLPNGLVAQKEYDYVCLYIKKEIDISKEYPFKEGRLNFAGLYEINIKKTNKLKTVKNALIVDSDLIPDNAVFRVRKLGDKFAKFGSGTKSLKDYFIDKKIPNKDRNFIPLLADNSEILCVVNDEISEKVKITQNTKSAYIITCKKLN